MDDFVIRLRSLRNTGAVLLPQIHRHAPTLPEGGPYDSVIKLIQKHPDMCAKLVKKFGTEHPREVNIDKVDKAGADLLRLSANAALDCLAPLYGLLEEIAIFQEHGLRLLTDLHQTLLPFSFEYTPELLEEYMGLFVHLCKIHMLASKMPRPLILQVYAFAYDQIHTGNPPHFTEVCNFVIHFQDAIPRLQAEFQPISTRIGDILENNTTSSLRSLSDFQQLRASNLFSVFGSFEATNGIGGMTPERTFIAMQALPILREWAILGLLVCPGETVRSELRVLLNLMLKDSFRYTLFRTHAEWLHPLFEKHVVPTMVAVAKKSHLSWGEKRDFKKLVERAFGEACEGAMQMHSMRRVWLGQQLAACIIHFSNCPGEMPGHLSMLLALLSLSRFEIDWATQHFGENLPRGLPLSWAKTSFSVSQPLKMGAVSDIQLSELIAFHVQLSRLLHQHRTGLRVHTAWSLWSLVRSAVKPMCDQVATAPTLTKNHEPVVQTIEKLVNGYENISKAYINKVNDQQSDVEIDLAALPAVQGIWYALNAKLFSVKTNVTGQSLDALISRGTRASHTPPHRSPDAELGVLAVGLGSTSDMSLVKHLNETAALAAQLSGMEAKLQSVTSLSFFCFQVPKLQALFTASLHSVPSSNQHFIYMLHVLGSFEENDCEKCSEDHGKIARKLSELFMDLVSEKLRSVLQQLFALWSRSQVAEKPPPRESRANPDGPSVATTLDDSGQMQNTTNLPISLSSSLKTPLSSVVRSSKDLLSGISISESAASSAVVHGHFWHSEPAATCLASLIALVEACRCSVPPQSSIQITSKLGMMTEGWLKDSLYGSVRSFIRQIAWRGKIIQRLSALESHMESFCTMLATIQPHTRVDLGMIVREVLLTQSYTYLHHPFDTTVEHTKSTNNSVSQITDWLMNTVVRDRMDIGVAYSTRLQTFFTQGTTNLQQQIKAAASGPPLDASQYASLAEIRAFIRVFGPYAALDANGKLELLLRELVIHLNSVLKAHSQFLAGMSTEQQAANDEHPLLQSSSIRAMQALFKQLGRCLFMRQLLSQACACEMPNYATCGLALYNATAGESGLAEPSALFNLPEPVSTGLCIGHDPAVVKLMLDLEGNELENWDNLGVLLGVISTMGDWVAAGWNSTWEVLSHDMHCLPHVLHVLGASLTQASTCTKSGVAHASDAVERKDSMLSTFLNASSQTTGNGASKPSSVLLSEATRFNQEHLNPIDADACPAHLAQSCIRSSFVQGLALF